MLVIKLEPGQDQLIKFHNTNGEKPVTTFRKYGAKITSVNMVEAGSSAEEDTQN